MNPVFQTDSSSARFVVESPFQALMAIEAKTQFGLDDAACELVILRPSETAAVEMLDSVIARSSWGRICDTGPRTAARQPARARAIRRLSRRKFDETFIGDYRSPLMRHVINSADGPAHLLDDGRSTFKIVDLRRSRGEARESRSRRLIESALRLDRRHPAGVDFFTIFQLAVPDGDTVTVNRLAGLRSLVSSQPRRDEHLLLGAPFVELGAMSADRYVDIVVGIARSSSRHVVMRPHRREDPEKLQQIRALGVDVVASGGPVEIDLLSEDSLPTRVSSFFSTASYTLWKLLGHQVSVDTFALERSDFITDFLSVNDGVPDLVEQSSGAIRVFPLPGRAASSVAYYRDVTAA